jgi:penicillin amidase
LTGLTSSIPAVEAARARLLDWDYRLDPRSVPAGIYAAWERELRRMITERLVPSSVRQHLGSPPLSRIIDWMLAPPGELGPDPLAARDSLAHAALTAAVGTLTEELGADQSKWRYGQTEYKHVVLRHPLGRVVTDSLRTSFEVGPAPRGGNGSTVNHTGNGNLQTGGASFRIITDTRDWDASVGINTPGQSGNPGSTYYRNLFDLWAADQFFPLAYTRSRVEAVAAERLQLSPE